MLDGESKTLSAKLYKDLLLDSATVHCESTGTNYCYSIGLDDLGLDLSDTDFSIEFEYKTTVNGSRVCLGDATGWSTGGGAGDNYIYVGSSTANNSGYGTKTSGTTDNTSTGKIGTNIIHRWKIVRSGGTISYYLNGTLKGTKTVPDWVADCHDWSLYLQGWNTSDITVKDVALNQGDMSGYLVNFYTDNDEYMEVIYPSADVEVASISLTGNKRVLSAYDSDKLTLTATAYDSANNPVPNKSLTFLKGSTEVKTIDTDNNGVATFNYNANGDGNLSFTVKADDVVSDAYTVSDRLLYRSNEYSLTKSSGGVLNQAVANDISLTLPSQCEISFDIKTTGGTSSAEHRLFIQPISLYVSGTQPRYGLFIDNRGDSTGGIGYRNNGNTVSIGSTFSTYTVNEYHTVRIVRSGSSLTFYFDGDSKGTQAINYLDNYADWGFYFHLWNNGTMTVRNLSIK